MSLFASAPPRTPGTRSADGHLPLEDYGALGDGRSVALSGADGSIDWWSVPNIDSPPLFDRLLNPVDGGCFAIAPAERFTVERHYRPGSNVLETIFTTAGGRAKLVESVNSGSAGRLPWAEFARRIEGLDGHVRFDVRIRFSRRADTISPYMSSIGGRRVFHADRVLGVVLASDGVELSADAQTIVTGSFSVAPAERIVVAIVAGEDEPLVVPTIDEVDERIDLSDGEWRQWSDRIRFDGPHRDLLLRSGLALKLLLFSPSGAIAAAATTSLPERIGGDKNFDYRFAWVRDAGYTIRAFHRIGAHGEAKAALTWLLDQVEAQGARVFFRLGADRATTARGVDLVEVDLPGYRGSRPVVIGNLAADQRQLGVFGDIFETVSDFVKTGNILDARNAERLSKLADLCADQWRGKDSGIWELTEPQHYTMSKISAWQALARAVELADAGQLPTTCRERWANERDLVAAWIGDQCWSETRGAYLMYPGSAALDASIALAVRFGFDGPDRLDRTLDAIDRELGAGPFHYRYSGMAKEEGCFLACTLWMIEARVLLGQRDRAEAAFDRFVAGLDRGVGVLTEMVDPKSGAFLGNMPQGLTHLAMIQTIATLAGDER